MSQTRILTATFPSGDQVTRRTHRNYTHVVRAYTTGTINGKPDTEFCFSSKWCGRFDLMQKAVRNAKNSGNKNLRIETAEITNDPWA